MNKRTATWLAGMLLNLPAAPTTFEGGAAGAQSIPDSGGG